MAMGSAVHRELVDCGRVLVTRMDGGHARQARTMDEADRRAGAHVRRPGMLGRPMAAARGQQRRRDRPASATGPAPVVTTA
jgi:hypothetical protein